MKEKLLILGAMVALCCSCAGNSVLLDTESELNGLNNEYELGTLEVSDNGLKCETLGDEDSIQVLKDNYIAEIMGRMEVAKEIVASDYNCERCVQFEKTLSKLYDNYKERVKFGFVHFADAPSLAALACEAAGEQKQFWTFHDTIFNYSGVADSAFIYNLAKSKRLNMTEFDAYLHSSDKYKEMDKVINQLVERGLMATPTIIINDRLVYVTNSYEELSRLLEYEL